MYSCMPSTYVTEKVPLVLRHLPIGTAIPKINNVEIDNRKAINRQMH